jgi:hypothetical protein
MKRTRNTLPGKNPEKYIPCNEGLHEETAVKSRFLRVHGPALGLAFSFLSERVACYASLATPCGLASVRVMRIPCSGRNITIGRGSMVWPGTRWN